MYPDTTGSGRERSRGGGGGGGIIIQLEVGGACHKEFHYFLSHIEKVDCAYCNFFSLCHISL